MEAVLESFRVLTDEQLLAQVPILVQRERTATTELIACLAEFDSRQLYRGQGYPSLYDYCTRALHLSEKEAYSRITAARTVQRFGIALNLLADGALTLTNLTLLAPHLTPDNHRALLQAVVHKTKRETQREIAALYPDRPEMVTWHIDVPVSTDDKLRHAQNLLRHVVPNGDVAAVIDRALTDLIANLEKRKLGAISRPRRPRKVSAHSRYIAAAVRRAVYDRDEGRCTFVGPRGRCLETGFLEFHHIDPYAAGGSKATSNIQLRCRAHNQLEAEKDFPLDPESISETDAASTPRRTSGRRGRGS
jgi:5-methylcytosine-specific restriction endonuclease McrA